LQIRVEDVGCGGVFELQPNRPFVIGGETKLDLVGFAATWRQPFQPQ
jgi:hypothetical protein